MKRPILTVVICAVSAVAAYTQSSDQPPQSAASVRAEREKPAAKVKEAPDAPLLISVATKWATPDQQMLEVYFTVKNIGNRPIRAYAVRVARGVETQEGGGCFFNSIDRAAKILQPNQSIGRSTWRQVPESDVQTPVEVTLDFVEFADGTVWGADGCQAAELFGGMRAGIRAGKLRFKRKLDEEGVDALIRRLYADDPDLNPPEGHSDAWKAGFRGAISSLRERIRQANVDGGLPEVEAALQKPFDASEN